MIKLSFQSKIKSHSFFQNNECLNRKLIFFILFYKNIHGTKKNKNMTTTISSTDSTSPLRKIVFIQRIAQFAGSSPRRALKLAYVNDSEWRSAILDFSFQQLFFDPFVKPLITLPNRSSFDKILDFLQQQDCALRAFAKFRKFLSFVFRCVSEENNEIIILVKQSLDKMLEDLQNFVGEGKQQMLHSALRDLLNASSFSWQIASWVAENTRNPNLFHFLFPVPTSAKPEESSSNETENVSSPTSPSLPLREKFWQLRYATAHQGILVDVNNVSIDPAQIILGFYTSLRGHAVELICRKCSSLARIAAKAGNIEVVKIICDPSRDTRFVRILENLYLANTNEVKTLWIAPKIWSITWQAIAAAQGGDSGRFDWRTSAEKEWLPLNVVRWLNVFNNDDDEQHQERIRCEHNHNVYIIVKFLLEELLLTRFDCHIFVGFNSSNWSAAVRASAAQMEYATEHPQNYSQEQLRDVKFNDSLIRQVTDFSTAVASDNTTGPSLGLHEINHLLSNTRKFKRCQNDTYGHHFHRREWASSMKRSCFKTIFHRACYRRQDELIRYFEQETKLYKESDRPPHPRK